MTTETIDLNPDAAEEPVATAQNVYAPVEPVDIRLNFNCMLYLFTELVALFNELVLIFKERGDLTDEEIERIYKITANKEGLSKVYQPVFNRFMEYYVATKQDVTGEKPQVVGVDSDTPAENSANTVSSTVTAETTVVQEEVKENS